MKQSRNLGSHEMTVELISIPKEIRRITIAPAINVVRFLVHTPKSNIIIYEINFDDDKKAALAYYKATKNAFGK